jgi:hypothetical protein
MCSVVGDSLPILSVAKPSYKASWKRDLDVSYYDRFVY